MGIIVRYILRELCVTFLIGFVALTGLLLIVGLVEQALKESLPLVLILQLVPFVFAKMSSISLPVTLLLAVTIFFSRMSGNNEVIALKALGISPSAFLIPVFVLAIIVSFIGIRINEFAVTTGQEGINTLIYRGAEDIVLEQLRNEKTFETDDKQLTIVVRGVDDNRRLIEPRIMLKRDGATLEARRAKISIDFAESLLTVNLEDVRIVRGGTKIISAQLEFPIPLSEIISDIKSDRPANMGLDKIFNEMEHKAEQIEQQRRILAAHYTFGTVMGSIDDWTSWQILNANEQKRLLQKQYDRLSVEPPRRWAVGFCCFFFVWLGAPLAIWMRKSDFFSSFFACFVPILLLYYPLLMLGLEQAKKGELPPMCVWLGNVAIGLIGLWFMRKIHRY